ncbi:hypothetical protein [Flavobacterium olei]|uniref:hypothetical protein n=1 Tax=Flavobacterium olei TaxID=1886782 RepID=UPI00321A6639
MKKSVLVAVIIILVGCLYFLIRNGDLISKNEDTVLFNQKLSHYGLFQGKISDLKPCDQAEIIELASQLFTDYAEKQRIIVLPRGKKMKGNGSGLPDFPDGTIIAKSFYYSKRILGKSTSRYIVETRLLLKDKAIWNAATYKWNASQDEAYLSTNGAMVPISFVDEKGKNRQIKYRIPSSQDCISCHPQEGQLMPIGPKLRNINLAVSRDKQLLNQIEYLNHKGKLEILDTKSIKTIANYKDESQPLSKRARAYLDINCAHCHNPAGLASYTQLDLRYELPFNETGIRLKQGNIPTRLTISGEMHMPKIGTTINHEEGINMIMDYIRNLTKH